MEVALHETRFASPSFSLLRLLGDEFAVFTLPLFSIQVPSTLNFLSFLLSDLDSFTFSLYSLQLAEFPGSDFGSRIK